VGVDLDVGSVVTARDNARLNAERPALVAGSIEALRGRFDRVLVNILPERWLPQAGAVVDALAEGGTLLVSGLLATGRQDVLEVLGPLRVALRDERHDGEWLALRLERR
jgi:ribosomal protein L11 methylase PrmA